MADEAPEVATRTFYRLIRGKEPDEHDFVSNDAMGKPCIDERYAEEWRGISVWSTENQAAKRSINWGRTGRNIYLAELRVPLDGSIEFRRTFPGQAGHHTLWGEPVQLLDLAHFVITISQGH